MPVRGLQHGRPHRARARDRDRSSARTPSRCRPRRGRQRRSGGAGWEPTFLAVTRVSGSRADRGLGRRGRTRRRRPRGRGIPAADHHAEPVQGRRRRLGPARMDARPAADRWRRIATGAGPAAAGRLPPGRDGARRPDGVLARPRLALDAARRVPTRSFGAPRWSARPSDLALRGRARADRAVLEALNDYLLALRFLLEGGGPADLGLSMRVACAVRGARRPRRASRP